MSVKIKNTTKHDTKKEKTVSALNGISFSGKKMKGVILPGDATAVMIEKPIPVPRRGQVLIRVKASSICGSDLRAIYNGHHSYVVPGTIAGHEPCGQVVAIGPGSSRFKAGDRVSLYHITGCGQCTDCRSGYLINCSVANRKAAYGWQLDGGHAEFILAEETTCIPLPDELSYISGALVACGFGTAYEALCRAQVNGRDSVLITGLGPVGLAVGLLAQKMGASRVVGTDISDERCKLAVQLGAVQEAYLPPEVSITNETFDVTIDCSGNPLARKQAIQATANHGRFVFVGEGGSLTIDDVSEEIIHKNLTLIGSWVTSTSRMEELMHNLVAWNLHPDMIVDPADRFDLSQAQDAYIRAAGRNSGKVCLVMQ